MKVRQVALLSTLIIDIAKDWGGYKIANLGAPTGAGEALRYGDEGLIDHDGLLNYVAAKHLTLPAAIAAVLTDHNLAKHPLAIIPTMDVAHIPNLDAGKITTGAFALARIPAIDDARIPDLDTLSGYPASDPVAGTAGLRTLGTGAQQAAAGNHTHTLTAEAQSVTKIAYAPDSYNSTTYYLCSELITADSESPVLITKTDSFSSLSRAVAGALVGAFYLWGTFPDTMKARLYMGGVQVAESAYLNTATGAQTLVGDRALSGSQSVQLKVYNYDASDRTLEWVSKLESTGYQYLSLVVGSVKI